MDRHLERHTERNRQTYRQTETNRDLQKQPNTSKDQTEAARDRQRQTETYENRQRKAETSRDKHRHTETDIDKKRHTKTNIDRQRKPETDKHTERQTYIQTEKPTYRQGRCKTSQSHVSLIRVDAGIMIIFLRMVVHSVFAQRRVNKMRLGVRPNGIKCAESRTAWILAYGVRSCVEMCVSVYVTVNFVGKNVCGLA